MDGPPERGVVNRRDLAWEARMIAEAEADAGLLIPSAEVKAWIDSLGTAKPLPMPSPATSWIKPSL
jgi:predicted transcriptional regulator